MYANINAYDKWRWWLYGFTGLGLVSILTPATKRVEGYIRQLLICDSGAQWFEVWR